MYKIYIETHFDAAHQLIGYQGECGKLHGHRWKISVEVETDQVNDIGICMDFKDLKAYTDEVINLFDHQHINEIPPFDQLNPTAENLAKFIFDEVNKKLPDDVKMKEVTVWESEKYAVTYYES